MLLCKIHDFKRTLWNRSSQSITVQNFAENVIWKDFSLWNSPLEFSFSFTFNFVVIWKHFRYVRMIQQTCVKFHLLFRNSKFFSTQLYFTWRYKYFATFSLEGSIHDTTVKEDGVENSQVEYKNYLSYAHFLSSSSSSFTLGRWWTHNKVIFPFHSALPSPQNNTHNDMCAHGCYTSKKTTEKIINGKTKSLLYEYEMRLGSGRSDELHMICLSCVDLIKNMFLD